MSSTFRMTASWKLLIAAVALLSIGRSASAQSAQAEPPSISTQGRASIKVAPDVAFLSISAEARASKPGDAQKKAADAMTSVQASVQSAGIPAAAIKTQQYVLQPEMEYTDGTSRVKGYLARNTIEVRVDDVSKLGAVIDAAGASGAARVGSVRFDVKNREAVEREALTAATKDAMARARAIAIGIGQQVVTVIRVQDERMGVMPVYQQFEAPMAKMSMAAAAPTPVTPGEIDVTAQLSLTVSIK